MSIIGSFVKLFGSVTIGFVSNPLMAIVLWAFISVMDYFWFSTLFTTLPPLDIFWGWDFLLINLGSVLGWLLATAGLNLSPMLSLNNNLLFNMVTVSSMALGIIPAIAYIRLPLPWNFIASFVLIVAIKLGSYFVTRLLVARHLDKTSGSKDPHTTRDKPYLGNYYTDMVFLKLSDITVTWMVCLGYVVILHVMQPIQYFTFLGAYPYNELWTQYFACIGLFLYVLAISLLYPKPSGKGFLSMMFGTTKVVDGKTQV